MKKIILVFFGLLILLDSCKSQDNKHFEGQIIYSIDYQNKNNPNDKPFGDKLVVQFKKGYIKREYNTGQFGGIKYEIVDPYKGLIYMELVGVDTIYWFDIKKIDSHYTLTKTSNLKSNEKILETACDILTAETSYTNQDVSFRIKDKYYYSTRLNIEPTWFKNYKYGFTDKIFNQTKALYLKFESITDATSISIEAVEIKDKSVDQNTFKTDPKKPLKEFIIN